MRPGEELVRGGTVGRQPPGQGHAGFVPGELGGVERGAVPFEGGLVAPRPPDR